MPTGLHINEHKQSNKGWIILSIAAVLIAAICSWYAYMYYTKGLVPPVPLPIATADPKVVETEVTQKQVAAHTVAPLEPRFLSIPKLGVNKSRVVGVGVTSTNQLDTPRNIHDVGWYGKSSLPGTDTGAVLVDGHNGGPTKGGVFEHLHMLKPGDIISIERGDGQVFEYKVVENNSIKLEEMNKSGMKEMSEPISVGVQGLNIISCTGNWIPKSQTYDHRQVVRASLVQN